MGLINALMERLAQTDAGLISDESSSFLSSSKPLAERRWKSWVHAEQARVRQDIGQSSRWLEVARRLGDEQPPPDLVWTAEYSLTTGELLLAVGEPGQAFSFLGQAFEAWQEVFRIMRASLTEARQDRIIGRSVEEFVQAMLGDETGGIDPGSPEVIISWTQERLIPGTVRSGLGLIRVASYAGGTENAEQAARVLLEWVPKVIEGIGRRIFTADIHRDLGTHYQEVGRAEEAVREAELGLQALKPASDDPLVKGRILQLEFNRANGLARCGREAEAIPLFEHVEKEFILAQEQEAALRARYARLHLQWKRGQGAAIRDDLRRLVAEYQAFLESLSRSTEEYAEVKAVLEQPYRLLLTVMAEQQPEDVESLQELFGIIAALRDESAMVESDQMAGVPAADLPRVLRVPIALLDRRLRRLPDAILLIAEPGVECVVFIGLSGGDAPLEDRMIVATAGKEFADAATSLIGEIRTTSHLLITRAVSARAVDAAPLYAAGEALARAVPDAVMQALARKATILYSPSSMGDFDDIPMELMFVGGDHMALTHVVARVPSLQHLLQILAPNRVNRIPLPQAAVVRAADPPELDQLDNADEDAEQARRSLGILGFTTQINENPTSRQLLGTLGSGIALVHYIGHGMAVEAGEHLFLGPTEHLAAFELDALEGTRTPFVYLSACLVGRGRHLAGGRLKGFAVALLEHGAPGVVAASYVVPDHVCAEISLAFYRGAWKSPAGEAMRQARLRLRADGFHPVCWTAFSLHGDPYVTVSGTLDPDCAARHTIDWPALLTRFLATRDEAYRQACLARLRETVQARPPYQAPLDMVAALLEPRPVAEDLSATLVDDLLRFDVEGAAAVRMLQAWNRLEALRAETSGDAHEQCLKEIGAALSLALRLDDSYAFAVFAAAHNERLMTTMEERVRVLRHAIRCLRAVEADERGLGHLKDPVEKALQGLESAIVYDIPGMLGVDPDLIQRADKGDEDALREINSRTMAREGSFRLAVSGGHWTDWMLQHIATGSQEVLKVLMAAIDQERKQPGRSDREIADLLWRYLSSYRGEGEADLRLYTELVEKLPPQSRERKTLDLFRTFDQIVSNSRLYPRSLAAEGELAAQALDHLGAAVYFLMLIAEVDIREERLVEARDLLSTVIEPLRRLAAEDPEYTKHLHAATMNIIALSQMIGDLDQYHSER